MMARIIWTISPLAVKPIRKAFSVAKSVIKATVCSTAVAAVAKTTIPAPMQNQRCINMRINQSRKITLREKIATAATIRAFRLSIRTKNGNNIDANHSVIVMMKKFKNATNIRYPPNDLRCGHSIYIII
jgi:hypothetical protein